MWSESQMPVFQLGAQGNLGEESKFPEYGALTAFQQIPTT